MRRIGIVAVKAVHSLIFLALGGSLVYFFWTGLRGRSDRRAAIAGAGVAVEALIYSANGFRCPLTDVAERLGAESGSVSDIYLPRWLREHLPFITGPIFALAVLLHLRNRIEARRSRHVADVPRNHVILKAPADLPTDRDPASAG